MNTAGHRRSLAIALTGGIATGKSAVTQRFARLGAAVFDADVIAHEVVAIGQPALTEITAAFGADALASNGALDRARMRDIVFTDNDARRRLEQIIHPRLRMRLLAEAQSSTAAYCILAIPLFVECREDYTWVDRVLTTDAPRETQLRRLMQRPGIDAQMAQRMLDAQATREQRLALADDVIDNTGPIGALDAIVARLHTRYLALGTSRPEA